MWPGKHSVVALSCGCDRSGMCCASWPGQGQGASSPHRCLGRLSVASCVWPGWSPSFKGVKYLLVHVAEMLGLGASPCTKDVVLLFPSSTALRERWPHMRPMEGVSGVGSSNLHRERGRSGSACADLPVSWCLVPCSGSRCSEGFLSTL